MSLSVEAVAVAKKYTDNSIKGISGTLAGKNCTIKSIQKVNGVSTITFEWIADDGTVKTSTMNVVDGKDGKDGLNGKDGQQGADGSDGIGISKIEKISTVDLVDTYRITFTDNSTFDYEVTNGKDGQGGGTADVPIEKIKVNGELQTPVNKVVDITVPEAYDDTDIRTELANKADATSIPSKVSVLENDSKYQTESDVTTTLTDYATKTYVGEQIANAEHLKREIVTVLPSDTEASDNIIYMLKVESATGNDKYQEYMKIDGTVQIVGDTSVDLTDYAKTTDLADYMKTTDADGKFATITTFKTLSDEVSGIKTKIGSDSLTTTADTLVGAINEVADKSEIVTLTKAEYEALADKDAETYYITTDDMTMYKGESQVLGGKSLVGKETVLYEGKITATGTYTLADDVNNYDLIVINHRQASGVNCESTTLSKYEISKCIDYEHKFMCVLGYGSSEDCISGYFNNDKLILSTYNNQNITSITGYKFGEVTVQNTITNPSPAASYSTDEQLTGGTWIDGKPIYRKVFVFASSITVTSDTWISIGVTIPDIDIIVSVSHYDNVSRYGGNSILVKNTSPLQCNSVTNIRFNYLILEYTKTTDA